MPTAMSDPTNAATGTAEIPMKRSDQLNVIASTAPSAAPVETPSVKGVARGLRSSPWKTTPAAAKSAPTQAPARAAAARRRRSARRRCPGTGSRVERAGNRSGWADQGRDQQRDHRQRPEPGDGAYEASL
jgi:hypothetical protein